MQHTAYYVHSVCMWPDVGGYTWYDVWTCNTKLYVCLAACPGCNVFHLSWYVTPTVHVHTSCVPGLLPSARFSVILLLSLRAFSFESIIETILSANWVAMVVDAPIQVMSMPVEYKSKCNMPGAFCATSYFCWLHCNWRPSSLILLAPTAANAVFYFLWRDSFFFTTIYQAEASWLNSNEPIAGLRHKAVDDTGILSEGECNGGWHLTPDTWSPEVSFWSDAQTCSQPSPSENPKPSHLCGWYMAWHGKSCPNAWNMETAHVNCFEYAARRLY